GWAQDQRRSSGWTSPAKACHRLPVPAGTHRLSSTPPRCTVASRDYHTDATSNPSSLHQRRHRGSSTPSPRAFACSFSFPFAVFGQTSPLVERMKEGEGVIVGPSKYRPLPAKCSA